MLERALKAGGYVARKAKDETHGIADTGNGLDLRGNSTGRTRCAKVWSAEIEGLEPPPGAGLTPESALKI
jgi:hypothetical protein